MVIENIMILHSMNWKKCKEINEEKAQMSEERY